MLTYDHSTYIIVHLQVPEFDAAQVQPFVIQKTSHVYDIFS